ncbi:zinc finger protein 39-like [Uranotaenia lowii]|uniref:zinc finger protein 39-like n=1 Tax=Uranotaenia lowii TaxID=190385 RepID=UPI002478DFAF|nr:zinc finger protein 39-like [Uranotaenia lowii]
MSQAVDNTENTNSKSTSPEICSELQCAICKRTYSDRQSYQGHIRCAHKKKKTRTFLACNKCNNKYDKRSALEDHYARDHLGVIRYACEFCGEGFTWRITYFRHRKEKHPKEYEELARQNDPRTTISFNKLNLGNDLNEILTDENLRERSCVMCIKMFPTTNELELHMQSLHSTMESFDCKRCDKTFYAKSDFELHLAEKHVGKPWFLCKICEKHLGSKKEYCVHHKQKHPEEYVKLLQHKSCDQLYEIDGYVIVELVSLDDELSNSSDDEVRCSSTSFAEKNRRRKYVCQICQKEATYEPNLALHQMNAHKIFDSSWCSRTKTTGNSSVPEFSYDCGVCGYWFRYKTHRSYHKCDITKVQNTENGTPHRCKICKSAFKYKTNLFDHFKAEHQPTHIHKCDNCEKIFFSRRHLEEHKFSAHYNKPLYRCTLCGKTSANNSTSFAHRKKFHTEELERLERPLPAYAFIEKLNK